MAHTTQTRGNMETKAYDIDDVRFAGHSAPAVRNELSLDDLRSYLHRYDIPHVWALEPGQTFTSTDGFIWTRLDA